MFRVGTTSVTPFRFFLQLKDLDGKLQTVTTTSTTIWFNHLPFSLFRLVSTKKKVGEPVKFIDPVVAVCGCLWLWFQDGRQ